jgi:SAM-dependent methyltransferase
LVFEKLILHIKGGVVADVGCGSVGWYWALGYIDRIDRLTFIDVNKNFLDLLERVLQKISPEWVCNNIESTVTYIQKIGCNLENATVAIHTKPINYKVMSISSVRTHNKYDYVLAVESLKVVKTQKEFEHNLQTIFSSLKSGGTLLFSILPYDEGTVDSIMEAQNSKLEGELNPDYSMVKDALKKVKFKIQLLESIKIPEHNYSNAIFGRVIKPKL